MHRDTIRYLTLLVIVRLLVGAACPAPSPWRRHRPGVFPARPAGGSASPGDRLTRDVTDRPMPRPRPPDRPGPASSDVTPGRQQLSRPRVAYSRTLLHEWYQASPAVAASQSETRLPL